MFRNQSVNVHKFAMIPHADIPRSSFRMQSAHKTTFDEGWLVPVYVDEVLPGDSFSLKMTAFCRMATPIVPVMDNLYLESFFFFVPNRLVWDNWKRFMGEQINPGDSISYTVPQVQHTTSGGVAQCSIFDYMGLPIDTSYTSSATWFHNAMPLRAYNLIWNEWFRDENLQNSLTVLKTDGPDPSTNYALRRRGKRHDYFTSCLPWPQKGNTAVSLPLGTSAPVVPITAGTSFPEFDAPGGVQNFRLATQNGNSNTVYSAAQTNTTNIVWSSSGLQADLTAATAATINQIRQAFQIQKLLERDARGGTRYTEIVRSHFGVISPDARLQRPEYLGGGSVPIHISPIAQTSATEAAIDTPQGNLAAIGQTVIKNHGFSQSFTEHGYIIGLVSVRADLTYQQGMRKLWSRSTRYDFYFPVFAALGEQAVLNKEIWWQNNATDDAVFGYQERWAEYRYNPSLITGMFRSSGSVPLDVWHLSQRFATLPTLNATFIEDTPPVGRVVAIGDTIPNEHFLFDSIFDIRAARPMPMYGVPGLIDHF